MNRWRSFLAAAGVAVVAASGYFITLDSGRTVADPVGRYRDGRGRLGREGLASGTAAIPAFLFASGSGMGTACSGTNPTTAATGQTITYPARSGNRICMKGGEFTNIAIGDLVILSANQYAIQPGGDGTGALGVSVWGAGKNWCPGSEDLDGADWTAFGSGAAAPTVTKDYALSPRNTMTMERVQVPATTAGQSSFIYSNTSCPVSSAFKTLSCFVRGTSGSGTTSLYWGFGAGGRDGADCDYVADSTTRCVLSGSSVSGGSLFAIGNSQVARGATDFVAWGCQCEDDTFLASPYMPTAIGATATRAAESAPTASFTAAGSSISARVTPVAGQNYAIDFPALSVSFDSSNEVVLPLVGSKLRCDFDVADTHAYVVGRGNLEIPIQQAQSCSYASSNAAACFGSACKLDGGALTLPTGAATIRIGGLQDGGVANATVKNICADPSGSLCKPPGAAAVTCPAVTSEAQTLAAIGDSIMVGPFDIKMVDEMSDRMCSAGRGAVSFAVSGSAIADCQTQYTTSVKGHAYGMVATDCGVNNLSSGGESAAVAWAKMEVLLADIVRDGGFHVVLGNVTPCGGYSGCGDVTGFNALEALWCADAGSRATCIDNYTLLHAASSITSASAVAATALGTQCLPTSDSLHPNNFCTTKLADAFADAALDAGL